MEHVLCHTSDSRNVDVVPRFMENVRTPDIYIYIYIYNSIFIYHTGWTIRSSNSGKGKIFFPSPKSSRPALGPTQPPIQSVIQNRTDQL